MDDSRFEHTLGVMYTCGALAMRYGYDLDKAMLAGLMHDCAKCMPNAKKLKMAEKHHLEISNLERKNPFMLHAKLGAFLAKKNTISRIRRSWTPSAGIRPGVRI